MSKTVLEVHRARVNALIKGDLEVLDQCVAGDLTFISPHGTVLTKAMVFDKIRNGKMKIERMDVDDIIVREFDSTAIITYKAVTTYTDDEILVNGTVRSTTVYLFLDNRWQLIAAQQSKLSDI